MSKPKRFSWSSPARDFSRWGNVVTDHRYNAPLSHATVTDLRYNVADMVVRLLRHRMEIYLQNRHGNIESHEWKQQDTHSFRLNMRRIWQDTRSQLANLRIISLFF